MADDIGAWDPNMSQEERLKAWEKEKRGLITDLQSEREKRQQLEQRFQSLEQRLNPPPAGPDQRLNRFAQAPDETIMEVVKPEIDSIKKKLDQMNLNQAVNDAYDWIAEQEGTTSRKIKGSDLDKDLDRIVREHGLNTLHPIAGVQAAYKILQQEREEKKKAEANRTKAIAGNTTETSTRTSGGAPSKFSRSYIRELIASGQYEKNRDAILAADRAGQITND